MQRKLLTVPLLRYWDRLGVAHVWAQTIADAYRGMGYAAGYSGYGDSPKLRLR